MKRLVSEITIGDFSFNFVTNLTIESSWNTFTDTATIIIPNKFRKDNKTIIVGSDNIFKREDPVEIKIGYFPNLITKFKGFLTNIRPDSPLVLECEDTMWLLKQVNLVSKSFINTTIKEVVEYATASLTDLTIEFDDPNAKIGSFQIDNKGFVNAVTVFEVLKKQFGYNIYFQDEILQVRILNAILSLERPAHKMNFQFNIIEDDLTFQRDDDVGRVVRFESKQVDNTVIILFGFKEKGEIVITKTPKTGGIVNSWKVPELSETLIRELITKNIDKYIWTGFQGSITTFLEPSVNHSDRIDLTDNKHIEKNGRYLIKNVIINFGINGGRQGIELRNKIGDA